MSSDRPIGQRFSHVYLSNGEPNSDSPRMRARLAAALCKHHFTTFGDFVLQEMGLAVSQNGSYKHNWSRALNEWELRDTLDIVTVFYKHLANQAKHYSGTRPLEWLADARRIFSEERMGYSIDEKGGVHFAVDAEFARNSNATIAVLVGSRYANARDAFESAFTALDATPPRWKVSTTSSVLLCRRVVQIIVF